MSCKGIACVHFSFMEDKMDLMYYWDEQFLTECQYASAKMNTLIQKYCHEFELFTTN